MASIVVAVNRESFKIVVAWVGHIGVASRSNILMQCKVNAYGVVEEMEALCLGLGVMRRQMI